MNLRSYIKTILTGLAISVMSACADSSEQITMPPASQVGQTVKMRLNVSIPEGAASRAEGDGYEQAVTDFEKISTLRIIIISEDNVVEVNHFMRLKPSESSGYNEFEVKADQKKTVILIANEPQGEGLTFSDYYDMAPVKGQFNHELYNALVTYDANELSQKPIPMSAIYTVPVLRQMAVGEENLITLPPLKVLRTATKFSFEITHDTGVGYNPDDAVGIKVGNIRINSIADRTYLFPHAYNTTHQYDIHHLEYVFDGTDLTLREPATSKAPVFSGGDGKDDFSYTDFFRDNYMLPSSAKHNEWYSPQSLTERYEIFSGKTVYPPSFYGHESGTAKVQEYTVTLDLFDLADNKIKTLVAKAPMDNLSRLPRNTHVVIRAKINPVDYNLEVEVFPYTSVTLRPVFGVDYNAAAHQQDEQQLIVVKNMFKEKLYSLKEVEYKADKYKYIFVDPEWVATENNLTKTIAAFETAINQSWSDYRAGLSKEYSPILTMDKYLTVVTDIQSLSSLAAYIINKENT